jgi:peptide/nickel transport system ATP-binding protein
LTAGVAIAEARALAGLPRLRGEELAALLEEVRLAEALLGRLPAAMSGGQRQRVALARALAAEPQVLIADEVTSALDRPLAFEVVDLLRARVTGGMGLLFVTHDLALLPGLVDRVMVMAEGEVVEEGATAALLAAPQQPATRALWAALPRLEGPRGAVT